MTYYEEFGLRQDATTEEIRGAYRLLVKLLHPDQQQDEQVRQVAERQMCRLNEILCVLTDERARMAYDQSLAPQMRGNPSPPALKERGVRSLRYVNEWAVRQWHLVLAGLVYTGLFVWYFATGVPPLPKSRVAAVRPPQESSEQKKEEISDGNSKRGKLQRRRSGQRRRSSRAFKMQTASLPDSKIDPVETTQPMVEQELHLPALAFATIPLSPPIIDEIPLPKIVVIPKNNGFIGTWLYTPYANSNSPKLRFEPVYIEMVVTDIQSELRGRYKGRYRALDNTTYPEVSFTFEGSSNGRFRWTGANGVEGEGNLKSLSADSLEVNWWTTVAREEPELLSGIAVLIRLRSR